MSDVVAAESARAVVARQFLTVLTIDLGRWLRSRRAILLYLLALVPVGLAGARFAAVRILGLGPSPAQDIVVFAALFRILVLRLVVFFGCVVVFTGLVRGEILDRSLHYDLLTPMSRSVLAAGKFASGLLATSVLFGASTALSWTLLQAAHSWGIVGARVGSWEGLSEVAAYVGVTVLGCLGYGAVFLACGLYFRTPFGPAVAILVWEGINIFLPGLLRKLSVIHYLDSLCPVPLPATGHPRIAILSSPSSPWIAVPAIVLLAGAMLALSVRKLRRFDVLYGAE